MKRFTRLLFVLVFLAALLPAQAVSAQGQVPDFPTSCEQFGNLDPTQGPLIAAISGPPYASAMKTCITIPVGLDGMPSPEIKGIVVFAHGYVFAYPQGKAVDIPWDQLVIRDPTTGLVSATMPGLINSMGFVFATTSYTKNGLAVLDGVSSVLELVMQVIPATIATYYPGLPMPPLPVFMIGASEGGLITTLAVEQHPDIFAGGVDACGPVGDFRKQINYWGDFRVVFDRYFPNVGLKGLNNDGTAVSIPLEVMADWSSDSSLIKAQIIQKLTQDVTGNHSINVSRLLSATGAPIDPKDQSTIGKTVLGILEYNVLATNEAKEVLGGNPFDNARKSYSSIPYDPFLNQKVARFAADAAALNSLPPYQTSGKLSRPLVILHTTGDPIVPYWHTSLYMKKASANGSLRNVSNIPVLRYGHCAFKPEEAVFAFEVMIIKAQLQALSAQAIEQALPDAKSREEFMKMKEKNKDTFK